MCFEKENISILLPGEWLFSPVLFSQRQSFSAYVWIIIARCYLAFWSAPRAQSILVTSNTWSTVLDPMLLFLHKKFFLFLTVWWMGVCTLGGEGDGKSGSLRWAWIIKAKIKIYWHKKIWWNRWEWVRGERENKQQFRIGK